MGKIHSMMDIGKRTMMNSQSALQTVAHNIANKTTEGYSRQRVDQVSAPPIQEGRLQLGMGARAAQVTRISNPFLDKQVANASGRASFLEAQSDSLSRVEQIFNEQQNKTLNQYISDFFNSFRELANNPESTTVRTIVKESAEALGGDFHRVDSQLGAVQKDIDFQLNSRVDDVNKWTSEIAFLNKNIVEAEIQGVHANDQRDRRELLVKKLTETIDIHVGEGENGMVNISTAGNALLVTGIDHIELKTFSNLEGRLEIYAKVNDSTPPFPITNRIHGGIMGGLLQVRDRTVPDLRSHMDQLAYSIATEVNRAHVHGFDRSGQPGQNFFQQISGMGGAAQALKLNSAIVNDVNRIAAAAQPSAPGDNAVATVISRLQYQQMLNDRQSTIDDYYNAQVGRIGVMTNQSVRTKEAQDNIVSQLENLRESVSGVNLDEEAAKMIEFQKAFDASARLIRTADEMFDTVLSLKRL